LGIKDINFFNRALLAKWMWKLKVDKSKIWRDVILCKFVVSDNNRRTITSKAQSWWLRDMCNLCEEGQLESWFHKQITWKVRTRNNILL